MIRYDDMTCNYTRMISSLSMQSLIAGIEYYSNTTTNETDIMVKQLVYGELHARLGRDAARSIIDQFIQKGPQNE